MLDAVAHQIGVVRDGPLPVPAPYSIIQTLAQFGGVVTETDDRWQNGVVTDGQVCADLFQEAYLCSSESPTDEKESGGYPTPQAWQSFTLYAPITCSSFGQGGGDRLRQRAQAYMAAAGPAGIERALETGVGDNKYLGDSDAHAVTSGAVDIVTALAELEAYAGVATFGKGGAVIHVAPRIAPLLTSEALVMMKGNSLVSMSSGYPVIVGQGYLGGIGSPASSAKMWITGQVQVRRSKVEMMPETAAEALDKSINLYEFRAEMTANVLFDTCLQAYAEVDLTMTEPA